MEYVKLIAESLLYMNGISPNDLESNNVPVTECCHNIVVRFNVAVNQLLYLVPLYIEKRDVASDKVGLREDLEKILNLSSTMKYDFDSLEYTSVWINLSNDQRNTSDFCLNDDEIELASLFAERCLDVDQKLLGQKWLERMPEFLAFVHSYCSEKLISLIPLVNRVNSKLVALTSDVLLGLYESGGHQYKFVRKGTSLKSHNLLLSSNSAITNAACAEVKINLINDFLQQSIFPGLVVCEHIHNESIVGVSEVEYISDETEFSCWKTQFMAI